MRRVILFLIPYSLFLIRRPALFERCRVFPRPCACLPRPLDGAGRREARHFYGPCAWHYQGAHGAGTRFFSRLDCGYHTHCLKAKDAQERSAVRHVSCRIIRHCHVLGRQDFNGVSSFAVQMVARMSE